jgi:hypothetical protein
VIRTATLLIVLCCLCSGCVYTFGMRQESREIRVLDSQEWVQEERAPELDQAQLSAELVGAFLNVELQVEQACTQTPMRTITRLERVQTVLPWWHWLVFGVGVASTGTGVGLIVEAELSKDELADKLRTRAEEASLDDAYVRGDVGIAVLSVGGLLLLSELIDALIPGDSSELPLPNLHESTGPAVQLSCGRLPGSADVLISAGTRSATVHTGQDGRASLPLAELDPAASEAVLSCVGCSELRVAIDPGVMASALIADGDLERFERWLSVYSEHPSAPALRARRDEWIAEGKDPSLPDVAMKDLSWSLDENGRIVLQPRYRIYRVPERGMRPQVRGKCRVGDELRISDAPDRTDFSALGAGVSTRGSVLLFDPTQGDALSSPPSQCSFIVRWGAAFEGGAAMGEFCARGESVQAGPCATW